MSCVNIRPWYWYWIGLVPSLIPLCLLFSLPCWKTFNLELSSHQQHSALPCSADSSMPYTSLPPVSSSPPLLLPHLVLSVKLPLPVSHVLVPSSCCDLHLWSCSRQCSAYDVATCFDHPVCLVSVSHSPFLLMFVRQQPLMPPAIKRCVSVTAYGMTGRHKKQHLEVYILRPVKYLQCQAFFAMLFQYCCRLYSDNTVHLSFILNSISVKVHKNTHSAEKRPFD